MVDFSGLFIFYEYIREFLDGMGLPSFSGYSPFYAWLFLALPGIYLVLSLVLRKRESAVKNLFKYLATASLGGFCIYVFQGNRDAIFSFANERLQLSSRDFIMLTGCVVSASVFAIALPLARRADKAPNNSSELNTRQKLFVVCVVAMTFLIGFLAWRFVPGLFRAFLYTVIVGAELISLVFWFYDPLIYILSHLVPKKYLATAPPCEPTPGKINRFAVIGCAHNEEKVIGRLIESLFETSYPKNMYDIYVICDNCTDGTAAVVRASGAIAMERNDTERRGKGFGLEWMFAHLTKWHEEGNVYDAYIVLDADNLVNEKYLDELNDKLNEGNEILQTYLGCKNPRDTWISKCYSMAYWLSNSNYQHAHAKVGLSAQMGGTGMVLRPSVLKSIGWKTDSLTEDLILTANYTLQTNKPCMWVHNARLYDEKPLKMKFSLKQRTRWMQGHMKALEEYGPQLLVAGIRNRSLIQLDMAFYLMRPFLNFCMMLIYAVRIFGALFMPGSIIAMGFMMNAETSTILLLAYVLVELYVLSEENYLQYLIWIPLQWIFTYSWYPTFFRGIIKRKELYWVSTIHDRNISIDEVREDVMLVDARKRLEGLDNLHRLPLGQLLLKATVITKPQLENALQIQKESGERLGDIVVSMNVLTSDTLESYLKLQKTMRDDSDSGADDSSLMLGNILVAAGVITEGQLDTALAYQQENGGMLGDCLIKTRCLTAELLTFFLSVQKVFDENYLSINKSTQLIKGLVDNGSMNFGTILYHGGLISRQQLHIASEFREAEKIMMGQALVRLGYISEETLEAILEIQRLSREFIAKRQRAD